MTDRVSCTKETITRVTEVRMYPGKQSRFRVYLTVRGECKVESRLENLHGRYLDEGSLTRDEVLQLASALMDLANSMHDMDEIRTRAVSDERERAANICEQMLVGGRAWTHDQQVTASALIEAAKNIRSLKEDP